MTARRHSILILDHDEDVLLRLEHLLETAGFDTTVTWRADDMEGLLAQREYDLVIIGHHPPEMDAGAVAKYAASRRVPWIVLDGAREYPFQEQYFYTLGAHAVLGKWASGLAERVRQLFPAAESAASVA